MNNKINWFKAILAGVLGTIAFDIVGVVFTDQWWDIPAIIGEKTGLGLFFGVLGHYSNGILISVLCAGIAPSLWGPKWLRVLTFTTGETVALVWFFMLPLLGAGVAGLELAPIIPVVTLLRHWAYGVALYFILHRFNQQDRVSAIQ